MEQVVSSNLTRSTKNFRTTNQSAQRANPGRSNNSDNTFLLEQLIPVVHVFLTYIDRFAGARGCVGLPRLRRSCWLLATDGSPSLCSTLARLTDRPVAAGAVVG